MYVQPHHTIPFHDFAYYNCKPLNKANSSISIIWNSAGRFECFVILNLFDSFLVTMFYIFICWFSEKIYIHGHLCRIDVHIPIIRCLHDAWMGHDGWQPVDCNLCFNFSDACIILLRSVYCASYWFLISVNMDRWLCIIFSINNNKSASTLFYVLLIHV